MVRWWIITGGYAVVIAALAVMPASPGLSVGRLDKLAHLCEYAVFAWCLRRSAGASGWTRRASLLFALSMAIAYGGALELVQGWLGYRSAEWGDAGANAAGALLGVWITRP